MKRFLAASIIVFSTSITPMLGATQANAAICNLTGGDPSACAAACTPALLPDMDIPAYLTCL